MKPLTSSSTQRSNGQHLPEAAAAAAPATDAGPPLLDLDRIKIDPALALNVPPSLALRRQVLPFGTHEGHVHVACANPNDSSALQALERLLSMPVRAEKAEPNSLKRALNRVYGSPQLAALTGSGQPRVRSVDVRGAEEPDAEAAVRLGDELLLAAILRQASDIHIDPHADGVLVRFRADGVLEPYRKFPAAVHAGLISRLKVLCNMDIAEKRAPQDGGFKYTYGSGGQSVDIRVATLPTKHGERMTLRLLALQTESLPLEALGMSQRDLVQFEQAIAKPHGMILLTGPTGSGKSTTLYAAIRRLIEKESLNVVTVEDPIEYDIPGVAQVEVDAADKVSFGKALRSILRHDPDVVMIGEIRDAETAGIAIKASLTGHLVFSTLHTNTAVGVVTRLADMGVERYLIGASLRLAAAQRLVRRLCPYCRQPHELTPSEASALGNPRWAGLAVFAPGGCVYCGHKGYHGRLGLFEMFPLDEELSRKIAEGVDETYLIGQMRERRILTLLDDAIEKLQTGQTSVREVLNAVTVW
ncbi:MAG: GspE/PulE family protein [Gemmataceae bacterium]